MDVSIASAPPLEASRYLLSRRLFRERIALVQAATGNLPLTYSMKANPALLHFIPERKTPLPEETAPAAGPAAVPDGGSIAHSESVAVGGSLAVGGGIADGGSIAHIEVCSPGELQICLRLGTDPTRILYSGVLKEMSDISTAVRAGVRLVTAESPRQFALLQEAAAAENVQLRVLLRLSSGNQFGMDLSTLLSVLAGAQACPNLMFEGIHYYSGTQKNRLKAIARDLARLREAAEACETAGFPVQTVEYGPGLAVDYFMQDQTKQPRTSYGSGTTPAPAAEYAGQKQNKQPRTSYGNGTTPAPAAEYAGQKPDGAAPDFSAALQLCEEADRARLAEAAALLAEAAKELPLALEMGRFLAAPCGFYQTRVLDLKATDGVRYAILGGGTHQLHYYGQTMAMQVPVLRQEPVRAGGAQPYCLCGSLCTVADVLVREAPLSPLEIGDVLTFARCGAYSSTEAPALFLSRDLPAIYLETASGDWTCLRQTGAAGQLNVPDAPTDFPDC